MTFKATICVDFDGTIVEHDPQLRETSLKPGVRDALTRFQELGFKIVIFSCRSNDKFFEDSAKHVKNMKDILDKGKIPYDEISDSNKPVAVWYIDDKAIPFRNDWDEITEFVEIQHKEYIERERKLYDSNSQDTDNTSRR